MTTPMTPMSDQINLLKQRNQAKYGTDVAYGSDSTEYSIGNGILGTLNLPQNLHSDSQFAWSISRPSVVRTDDRRDGFNPDQAQLTTMTMAGAMDWLRNLAVNQGQPGGAYDQVVAQLVAANYLKPSDARYGSFTSQVANAFLQSAADVWHMNGGQQPGAGVGQLVTWGDHINGLIQARIAAGQIDKNWNPVTKGRAAPTPTRTDSFTSPETVKAGINSAAENILGRKLTDKEAAGFQSLYHSLEQTANDQVWAQQQAQANNASSSPALIKPPAVSDEAQNYMEDSPAFGQERTDQLLGGYISVLRNMTGLGSGGVDRAIG